MEIVAQVPISACVKYGRDMSHSQYIFKNLELCIKGVEHLIPHVEVSSLLKNRNCYFTSSSFLLSEMRKYTGVLCSDMKPRACKFC